MRAMRFLLAVFALLLALSYVAVALFLGRWILALLFGFGSLVLEAIRSRRAPAAVTE